MTIENMTAVSYGLLVVAVMLGIIALILFFALKIPKANRVVRGQRTKKQVRTRQSVKKHKKTKNPTIQETKILYQKEEKDRGKVKFTVLQDITYIHINNEDI